jgi:hypothetical protein
MADALITSWPAVGLQGFASNLIWYRYVHTFKGGDPTVTTEEEDPTGYGGLVRPEPQVLDSDFIAVPGLTKAVYVKTAGSTWDKALVEITTSGAIVGQAVTDTFDYTYSGNTYTYGTYKTNIKAMLAIDGITVDMYGIATTLHYYYDYKTSRMDATIPPTNDTTLDIVIMLYF